MNVYKGGLVLYYTAYSYKRIVGYFVIDPIQLYHCLTYVVIKVTGKYPQCAGVFILSYRIAGEQAQAKKQQRFIYSIDLHESMAYKTIQIYLLKC